MDLILALTAGRVLKPVLCTKILCDDIHLAYPSRDEDVIKTAPFPVPVICNCSWAARSTNVMISSSTLVRNREGERNWRAQGKVDISCFIDGVLLPERGGGGKGLK